MCNVGAGWGTVQALFRLFGVWCRRSLGCGTGAILLGRSASADWGRVLRTGASAVTGVAQAL
jgi:hypothetical protein